MKTTVKLKIRSLNDIKKRNLLAIERTSYIMLTNEMHIPKYILGKEVKVTKERKMGEHVSTYTYHHHYEDPKTREKFHKDFIIPRSIVC